MRTMINMRTIRCAEAGSDAAIAEIRRRLSLNGEVVSPAGRARTIEVFGEPLTPSEVVRRICRDVRERGLASVLDYTRKLDRVELSPETVRVSPAELRQAYTEADPELLGTLRRVRTNIWQFQTGVVTGEACLNLPGKYELSLRYRPLRRVGICIPGGAAAYPSTLLMTAVPAQTAGVRDIAVVSPPTKNGANNRNVQAVCELLGIREVYRIGGAQGVAALAYGCEGIEPVDKIVGPGNIFVTLAKREVFGQVDIDMLAGPTEVVLIADDSANARYLASDLISQAEHSPGASLLITWHDPLIEPVARALEEQLEKLPRGQLARESLEEFGAMIIARDRAEAIELANLIAPEHLHVVTSDAEAVAREIESAGAIFIGEYSPVAIGDYVAGPSHVLPTGGSARFASGLCANDFLKRSSVIRYTADGLRAAAADVRRLAEIEGLTGHSASVDIRLNGEVSPAS
ncbi:MAG: histidinol dehydrogenase [Planctomycetes bacterium]|nr:histidinol dehydrogenase [Planctomycetota bacterium]